MPETYAQETLWNRSSKLGQIHKPNTHQLLSNTEYGYRSDTFLFVYRRDPKLPLHQHLEPMPHFLGDPESGQLNLENQCLALAMMKTLDEKCFRKVQKTTDRKPPSFQLGDRVYFKNKQPEKYDSKWRPGYKIVCIEHDRHYLHIENQSIGKTNHAM